MTETIIRQYDFNLAYANALVADLSETQMTTKPGDGLENHPAFTLGHLITGSAGTVEDLGGTRDLRNDWWDLFVRNGPGDPRFPDPDASKYPNKNALVAELKRQHNRVKEILLTKTESELLANIKWRFDYFMPTVLDLVTFMCINHEAMHLGQLAAWRRAMKLPSALASL